MNHNKNYFGLIIDITEGYEDDRKREMMKTDHRINKQRLYTYSKYIQDSPQYGNISIFGRYYQCGKSLRRLSFTPATPVIIDCIAKFIPDPDEDRIQQPYYCTGKLKLIDKNHYTLNKLFSIIGDDDHDAEKVLKGSGEYLYKDNCFLVKYKPYTDRRKVQPIVTGGVRIIRIYIKRWVYEFTDPYDLIEYSSLNVDLEIDDIKDITEKCFEVGGLIDKIK